MLIRLFLFLGLFTVYQVEARLNVDSLRGELVKNYSFVGTKSYLMEEFTSYLSKDSLDRYDLFLDSVGNLHNYIGLAIVHISYDTQNRMTLIEGFDSLGNRSYWDFPQKTVFRYVSDTSMFEMSKALKEAKLNLPSKELSVRIDYEIDNNETSKVRYHIFTKDKVALLTYSICSSGNVCRRSNNVYYELYIIGSDGIHYSANYFFDQNLKLIDGPHSLKYASNWGKDAGDVKFSYAKIVREKNNSISKIQYYNSKHRLVFEDVNHNDGTILYGNEKIILKKRK